MNLMKISTNPTSFGWLEPIGDGVMRCRRAPDAPNVFKGPHQQPSLILCRILDGTVFYCYDVIGAAFGGALKINFKATIENVELRQVPFLYLQRCS